MIYYVYKHILCVCIYIRRIIQIEQVASLYCLKKLLRNITIRKQDMIELDRPTRPSWKGPKRAPIRWRGAPALMTSLGEARLGAFLDISSCQLYVSLRNIYIYVCIYMYIHVADNTALVAPPNTRFLLPSGAAHQAPFALWRHKEMHVCNKGSQARKPSMARQSPNPLDQVNDSLWRYGQHIVLPRTHAQTSRKRWGSKSHS